MIGSLAQGDATPAALRAALDSVFTSPAYRWAEVPAPERWLREWWERLGNWLAGLRADNPAVFRILVFALLVALIAMLAHGAWIVWRTAFVCSSIRGLEVGELSKILRGIGSRWSLLLKQLEPVEASTRDWPPRS